MNRRSICLRSLGDGVALDGTALPRLVENVVSDGREFSAVLVWNYSRNVSAV